METFGGGWTEDREEFSSHWVAAAFCASQWLLPSFRDTVGNCTILWHSVHASIHFKEWENSKGWGFFFMVTLAFLGFQHTYLLHRSDRLSCWVCTLLWWPFLELKEKGDRKIARFFLTRCYCSLSPNWHGQHKWMYVCRTELTGVATPGLWDSISSGCVCSNGTSPAVFLP